MWRQPGPILYVKQTKPNQESNPETLLLMNGLVRTDESIRLKRIESNYGLKTLSLYTLTLNTSSLLFFWFIMFALARAPYKQKVRQRSKTIIKSHNPPPK